MTRELTEITVIGGDKTGLIANVTTLLFERGINVEDLDQAVREGIFRMTLHADTSEMTCSRDELRDALTDLGDELGVDVQVRFPSDRKTREIAVLVTKESHCLEALFEAWANDDLGAEISVVIGNHDTLEPLASHYDVPFHDIGDEKGTADEDHLLELLEEYDVDLIVLARYMRILGPNVVFRYEDRIINIHPSLLPAFPGAAAYRQAKEGGVRIAGVTAHYVTTDLDQGPIIAQRAFDVPDDATIDEIKSRGQPLEADALLEAVKLHLNDDITVHRGRTSLRSETDAEDYQLGLSREAQALNPDRPVDGLIDGLGGEREALTLEPSED
ncbi:formyltetrahydrofolate deformylase [Haloferax mediterranei ATCC 33500]|uniref:Formyltetrahydrofolate deformylase n=1 Tax=Haloferax mediterranei (strain ATCC 33500 / DSM 1411 / JCM 8866 / NBRC 14739 / NCIMB 2177 / R-4) TaxID=523841 RepID=I3R6S7_HALMT|nr:formyltetrahydrofolate deformylase [Haloferax mediterranei]AFK19937.1 formyltetrahydrofolate deformylase [Haloferax mediterranei ATCC 33500]AHZ23314.1 formyltetrahydrofolate deformylase [Haloferax mediterranei ATCC 33500]ELZ99481.1 formyltetrahydrofolate deformylase [Haloferax mediterranei ATCC 33500]MDX5987313.1 formyltetrahydrofolate deformylase [Haloferax mediterranei ATCC 33500]QCQ73828.1 formyltetrahydrofolate deformylase [Haloferax mediterranei ATCC 33500]